MTKSAIALGAALLSCATVARAADQPQGPFTISASMRLRVESIDGQFRPAPAPENDTMVSLKTTVEAEYDAGPVRFGAEVWDARSWGQDRQSSASTSEVNALELVQANAKVELGGKSLLTLGLRL